jgi:hypothetical protein
MFRLKLLTPGSASRPLVWDETPSDLVSIQLEDGTFSFWSDQVTRNCPIVLPRLHAVVTTADDDRDYETVVLQTGEGSGLTALNHLQHADEDSYLSAAGRNRQLKSPTWLGLGRDLRTFGFNLRGIGAGNAAERMWDWIAPQWHGEGVKLLEAENESVRYHFMVGRGIGPHEAVVRRLSEGTLPIIEASLLDGHIRYELTAFVSLERQDLSEATNRGTHFLRADGHSAGHMFTPAQQQEFDDLEAAQPAAEETVAFMRVTATNIDATPRYAFLKLPAPFAADQHFALPYAYHPETGASGFGDDRVFCVASLDGSPLRQEEMSILLQPGCTAVFDIRVPHRPIPAGRAAELRSRNHVEVLHQVRTYWRAKLDGAASISLPERRLSEMVAAGLLHLDLVAYGEEPAGTLAPTIGIYSPIGSESAPIIQFFDSMGRPDLARRSLQYFLDKQHDDGFMQNFGGYMLETEAALWSLGEHFRYTGDVDWVASVLPSLEAAVEYILRNRRRQQESGTTPYNLIVGKTADPEDPYAAFMLNGYAYLGLARAAEMVADVDSEKSKRWADEAQSLRRDIRAAFEVAVGRSPVVPLGNGDWVRTAPPWPGQDGPLAIDRAAGRWFTHGAIQLRDSLLGPLWLAFQEVLEPGEGLTSDLLNYHAELFHHDNTAFSQPYYSPHPLLHLRRGEVKAFLRSYYTMVASLADPETYSFWEHYFHASPHKTHEEAWFLMQTRWMLYLERGDELRLLPGIPRAWLSAGEQLQLKQVRSYFGPIDLDVEVSPDGGTITVHVACDPRRAPAMFSVRLPHASGRRATVVEGGRYEAATETVLTEPRAGQASLKLTFP